LGATSQDARPLPEHGPSPSSLESFLETPSRVDTQSLVDLADRSFSGLGYAQAARTYDRVLQRPDAAHDRELLSKAGDAHYFSGNLREAHRLYGKLYRHYGPEGFQMEGATGPDVQEMGRRRRALRLDRLYSHGGALNSIGNDSLAKWEPA